MKSISLLRRTLMLAGISLSVVPAIAFAQSLSGNEGNVRHAVRFMDSTGPCQDVYRAYVKASGHSAYAQTHRSFNVEAYFCGHSVNAPSQQIAEERAVANCNAAFKQYKVRTAGRCTVYASK